MGSMGGKPSRQEQYSGTEFPMGFVSDFMDVYGTGESLTMAAQRIPATSRMFGGRQYGDAGPFNKIGARKISDEPMKFGPAEIASAYKYDRSKMIDFIRLKKRLGLGDEFTAAEWDTAYQSEEADLSNRSMADAIAVSGYLHQKDKLMRRMKAQRGVDEEGNIVGWEGGQNPFVMATGARGEMQVPRWEMDESGQRKLDEDGNPIPVLDEDGNQVVDNLSDPAQERIQEGFEATGLGGAARVQADTGQAVALAGSNVQAEGGVAQGFQVDAPEIEEMQKMAGAESDIAQGDFNQFQQSAFKALYNPVRRSLEQEHSEERDRMRSLLAGSGMLGSVPHELKDLDQRQLNRKLSAMEQASAEASRQTLGHKFTEEMANADREQQARLANQQWTNERRMTQAKMLLTAAQTTAELQTQASIATSQNQTSASIANAREATARAAAQARSYIEAVGLNMQQEQAAKDDFLGLMGLMQADMARVDQYTLSATSMMYDVFLRDKSLTVSAGAYSYGLQRGATEGSGAAIAKLAGTAIGAAVGTAMGNPGAAAAGAGSIPQSAAGTTG